MCLVLSQTRLFSEALASIDGFVLMFIPNFYLFLSVEVLVLAVFCVCPFERRCELLANLANAPKELVKF